MAIADPRVHLICGICGNNKMMKFRIRKELNDDTAKFENKVSLSCKNCGSLTGLEEIAEEEK